MQKLLNVRTIYWKREYKSKCQLNVKNNCKIKHTKKTTKTSRKRLKAPNETERNYWHIYVVVCSVCVCVSVYVEWLRNSETNNWIKRSDRGKSNNNKWQTNALYAISSWLHSQSLILYRLWWWVSFSCVVYNSVHSGLTINGNKGR